MKYLFLLVVLLIGYGSLYPFGFSAEPAPFSTLLEPSDAGRGDLLGNLALFLPFGYLAMVAWSRPPRPLRFGIVMVAAVVYAAALQWVQLYLPSRHPSLRDVVPNTIGAAVGALAGATPLLDPRRLLERGGARAAPWVLIALWLGYRLMPFVPTIDWQEWKDALKPLRDGWSPFPWVSAIHDAAAWAAVGCLWAAAPAGRFGVRWLPLLAAGTLGAEVVIVSNWLSPGNVLGAFAGVGLVPLLAPRPRSAAVFLALAIVLSRLEPFVPRGAPGSFDWVPFGGFLQGSMLINAQNLFEKAFLYGALVWLVREAGLRLGAAAGGVALLLLGIEVAQTRLDGHTAEVTDPLLALLAALFLRLADPPRPPPIPVESPESRKEDL